MTQSTTMYTSSARRLRRQRLVAALAVVTLVLAFVVVAAAAASAKARQVATAQALAAQSTWFADEGAHREAARSAQQQLALIRAATEYRNRQSASALDAGAHNTLDTSPDASAPTRDGLLAALDTLRAAVADPDAFAAAEQQVVAARQLVVDEQAAWVAEQADKAAREAQNQAEAAARAAAARQPEPDNDGIALRYRVVNTGGQDAVDACAGGLTRYVTDLMGRPYYPIHRGCGGAPILDLYIGDKVQIDDHVWVVTDSLDVPKASGPISDELAAQIEAQNGQAFIQTCYYRDGPKADLMRLVSLTAA